MGRALRTSHLARWHRWGGMLFTIPLLAWMVSATAMTLATAGASNGLAGVFTLRPTNSIPLPLERAPWTPAAILKLAAPDEAKVFSLRLESRGPYMWYVVKTGPNALARTFDARTGKRLDPLPDSLLTAVANEALVGSRVVELTSAPEANRFYLGGPVSAVRARLEGQQRATLVLSRDEGRTLRRFDERAATFEWWYRRFHVVQYTERLALWTSLLYGLGMALVGTTVLGLWLLWRRRSRYALRATSVTPVEAGSWTDARWWHRLAGGTIGGVLVIQLAVGMYLWLCLGPLEHAFRGTASIAADWHGGVPTDAPLADPATVLTRIANTSATGDVRAQAIEWRRLGDRDVWMVTWRRDRPPIVYDARTATPLPTLRPDQAGAIAQGQVVGRPSFFLVGSGPQLVTDLNRPVEAYRFRFADPWTSDIYVSQATGDVVQRRPRFWRFFDPLLAAHTLALSGNSLVDHLVFAVTQGVLWAVLVTGWVMQRRRWQRSGETAVRESREDGSSTRPSLGEAGAVRALARQRIADRVAQRLALVLPVLLASWLLWKLAATAVRDAAVRPGAAAPVEAGHH
ncbi:MAG: hypothetical protein K2R93_00060 [Gemmatimonadaceae bacterium]|nr:hypothetical protein [Gemmatimonadaceae bacterium]